MLWMVASSTRTAARPAASARARIDPNDLGNEVAGAILISSAAHPTRSTSGSAVVQRRK